MKKILLPAVLLLVAALTVPARVLPAEQLLPDDTLILLTIPDFAKAAAIYTNSPQVQFWNDDAMKPFRDKFMDKLRGKFISPLEHELGVHLDDYARLPQGQITVAMVQDGWLGNSDDTKMPSLLLLLDTKTNSTQLKKTLTDLKKKWVDAGRTVKTEKIRDIEFSEITVSSNDLAQAIAKGNTNQPASADSADKPANTPPSPQATVYIGQAESLLIVGNSGKVIEKVLAAMSGGDVRTLSQVPAYAANHDAMFREAPVFGWVNARAFVGLLRHATSNAPPSDTPPDKIITALGLDGLKTIAFSYLFSDEGAQFNFLLGVPEDNRTGIFNILAGEAKDSTPPAFVPADSIKFQRWRIDGSKVWDGLRKIIGDVSAQGLGGVDFMLGSAETKAKEKDPDFDLKKNLFGNLGDDFITYQKAPKSDNPAEVLSPPVLYLVGSPHPEQLAAALNALMVLVGPEATPTSRDFLGRKIYSLPLPSAGMAGSGTNQLNYASSGGYLAISADAPMLEEYLRSGDSQASSLRDLPGLQAATAKVTGPGTSLFGYSNQSETMREFFNLLKRDSSSGSLGTLAPLGLAMGLSPADVKDWFDTSLLPDFSQVSRYFSFSVYGGSATPDGLSFKAFQPSPPQLNK